MRGWGVGGSGIDRTSAQRSTLNPSKKCVEPEPVLLQDEGPFPFPFPWEEQLLLLLLLFAVVSMSMDDNNINLEEDSVPAAALGARGGRGIREEEDSSCILMVVWLFVPKNNIYIYPP